MIVGDTKYDAFLALQHSIFFLCEFGFTILHLRHASTPNGKDTDELEIIAYWHQQLWQYCEIGQTGGTEATEARECRLASAEQPPLHSGKRPSPDEKAISEL